MAQSPSRSTIKVSALPKDTGSSGWHEIAPPRAKAPSLDRDIDADFLVVGAGFAGLTATWRLRELHPSAQIVLVDAGGVGEGPAGRNSGFMIDLPHDLQSQNYGGALDRDHSEIAMNRHAIAYASQMASECAMGPDMFQLCGKVNAAATAKGQKHITTYAKHLEALGEDFRVLDAGQMQQLTGSSYYSQGLFTPGTAMIQPAAYTQALAEKLLSKGVGIFEDTPITALNCNSAASPPRWTAATAAGACIQSPTVILAVNGHLNSFGIARGRLMPIFTYASMTRALTGEEEAALGGEATWSLTPSDPLGTTVRKVQSKEGAHIVVRNRFTYEVGMEVSQAKVTRIGGLHDHCLAARFPALSGIQMHSRWGGRLSVARNGGTVFRQEAPGLFAAGCQNGLGAAKGTLQGKLVAEWASGLESEWLDALRNSPPPSKLLPEPLMSLGVNSVLSVQEILAGRER